MNEITFKRGDFIAARSTWGPTACGYIYDLFQDQHGVIAKIRTPKGTCFEAFLEDIAPFPEPMSPKLIQEVLNDLFGGKVR